VWVPDQAKKNFDGNWDRLGHYLPDPEPFSMHAANTALGKAYLTISEAKILSILGSSEGLAKKCSDLQQELAKVSKFSKLFDFKIKKAMHSAIKAEVDSILVDA
jgi:hypothetical protein